MPKEAAIVEKILKLLRERGAYAVKYHGSIYSTAGVPDVLACYQGFFLGIEVKKPGEKPSELQIKHQRMIAQARGFACVVDNPVTVRCILDALDKTYPDGPVDQEVDYSFVLDFVSKGKNNT